MTDAERFHVAVVTVVEVETTDWIDAANVAEGVVTHALRMTDSSAPGASHAVVKFRRRGYDYQGTILRPPVELSRAVKQDYFGFTVTQPRSDDE